MWYSGENANGCYIGHAASPDGLQWTRDEANPILSPSQQWERRCTDAQSILFDGEAYHMWYSGGAADTDSWQSIGHATSPDGLSWTKSAGNPVLREGSSQQHVEVGIPCALYDARTKTFEMWYTAIEPPDGSVLDLGYATSMDGIAWARHPGNPVLSPGEWDSAIVSPAVLFDGARYRMWYKGDFFSQFFSYATAPWSIPRASFSAAPAGAFDGEPVAFDASLSVSPNGEVTSYSWDFGDGEKAEGPTASHAYAKPGHYTATLAVRDASGKEGSVARAIEVRLRPGDVAPWTSADVGELAPPSAARFEGEGEGRCLSLHTEGGDISLRDDAFHFVERELHGDFTLTARVASLDASSSAKVGLMVREGLEADARHAAIVVGGASGGPLRLVSRLTAGGLSRTKSGPAGKLWLRLERRGGAVTAFASGDGETWDQVGDPVSFDPPLGVKVHAGVAAAGGRAGVEGGFQELVASVCGLQVEQGIGPFIRGDCNGDGAVTGQVTDAVFLLAYSFMGGAAPPCLAAADVNADGSTDISDAVYLLGFNFLGGPAPASPFPACGASEAAGDLALGCEDPLERCP